MVVHHWGCHQCYLLGVGQAGGCVGTSPTRASFPAQPQGAETHTHTHTHTQTHTTPHTHTHTHTHTPPHTHTRTHTHTHTHTHIPPTGILLNVQFCHTYPSPVSFYHLLYDRESTSLTHRHTFM